MFWKFIKSPSTWSGTSGGGILLVATDVSFGWCCSCAKKVDDKMYGPQIAEGGQEVEDKKYLVVNNVLAPRAW